ncbi:MAG TPA: class I SAM-dependent methyltransferase [Thermodesulfobacteriota bacterium]|nr:class I SAM-dependent methyltransferase [Thermodesulfobacteriota bacterium]
MAVNNNSTNSRNYDAVASHYEFMANIYSNGKIKASKLVQVAHFHPGDRILYAGVGSGEDAIEAAKKNTHITCVDLSSKMLENAKKYFANNNLDNGEFICADIMEHDRPGYYDVVTANYFLNIFPEPVMKQVLEHLSSLLKKGGKLLIADFAAPQGNILYSSFQWFYHALANSSYWIQGLAPLHCVYDYPKYITDSDLKLVDVTYIRLFKHGPIAYQSILSQKSS